MGFICNLCGYLGSRIKQVDSNIARLLHYGSYANRIITSHEKAWHKRHKPRTSSVARTARGDKLYKNISSPGARIWKFPYKMHKVRCPYPPIAQLSTAFVF